MSSTRGYSAAGVAYLNDTPEFYHLVFFDSDTPLYLTTCPYDLVYDSQTWLSSAIISDIPTFKESLGMRPNNITLDMAGSALVNQALTFENYNNNEVRIYRYLVDTAETVLEYVGYIQSYKKSENRQSGKSVISWSIASQWYDWGRRYGRVIHDQEQQNLHTGDRFLEYFHLTRGRIDDWAEADQDFGGFVGGLITDVAGAVGEVLTTGVDIVEDVGGHVDNLLGTSIFGGGGGDHVTAPKQKVDDRVGNAVDPESKIKRVPVCYGEGRTKGIPIFRSLDPANKEFLYVVYLLSEGQIDGLTGNKIEFKNGEPYTSSRVSPYCTLVAEYDGTQTTADSTLTSVFDSAGTGTGYLTSAAHSEGDTTISVDTGTGTILTGDIVEIDERKYSVATALSGGSFTIVGGLAADVANNTAVTVRALWTANHVGNGLAYAIVKYKKSLVWRGEPSPAFVLKGKHLYDPRDGTTAYKTQPALVAYDLLTDTIYGKGISSADIDLASFGNVATLGETTNNDHGGEDGGTPASVNLFSFDGTLITNNPLRDNIQKVLFNCRGYLAFIAGKYKIIAAQTSETSVYSFDEDNISGDFNVFETPATAQYNKVLYELVAPDFDYRPWVETQSSSTYLTQDGGKASIKIIKNIYERNRYRGKNRAATEMKKSREGIRVNLQAANADAMSIEVGQIVDITRDSEGWTNKLFRVVNMSISRTAVVKLDLEEYESTVYDWSVSVEDTPPSDTDLPDPRTVSPPTGLTVASGATHQLTTDDGTTINRLYNSFTASIDLYCEGYNCQYKPSGDTNYIPLPDLTDRTDVTFYISDVKETQDYDVRVRSYNAQGTVSAWVSNTSNAVTGSETVGSDVEIIGADSINNNSYHFTTKFDSIDGFHLANDATLVTSASSSSVQLSASTTGLVHAIVKVDKYPVNPLTWDNDRIFRASCTVTNTSSLGSTGYMEIGPTPEAGFNAFLIKLKWDSVDSETDVYLTSRNSTGSTTDTLITSTASTSFDINVKLIHNAGVNVEAVIDIGGTEYTANHSTTIPSGTGSADHLIYTRIRSDGSTGPTLDLTYASLVQAP